MVRLYVLRISLPKNKNQRRRTINHDNFIRAADSPPFLQLQLCSFAHYPPGTWPEVSLGSNIPRNFDAKPTTDSLTHRLTAPPASPSISPTCIHYYKHCKTRQRPGISCLCLFFLYVLTLATRLMSPICNIHRIKWWLPRERRTRNLRPVASRSYLSVVQGQTPILPSIKHTQDHQDQLYDAWTDKSREGLP